MSPVRSYAINLDALKRVCDGTDTWVGGESQVILPTSTVRVLIEIAETAEKAWPYCQDAADEPNPKDELWQALKALKGKQG